MKVDCLTKQFRLLCSDHYQSFEEVNIFTYILELMRHFKVHAPVTCAAFKFNLIKGKA
jgi:hypothetical protein